MTEDVVKRLPVTFRVGLPHGIHAVFKHKGERWIAYPQQKNTRIVVGVDRMIGIFTRIHDDMLRWINHWPDDAERVCAVVESVDRARKLQQELITEKTEARTM